MMPLFAEHKRRIRASRKRVDRQQIKRVREDEIPAIMGKVTSTGAVVLNDADLLSDTTQIYVRLYGDEAQTRAVWCQKTGKKAKTPCWLRYNKRGELYVDRLEEQGALEFLQGAINDYATPVAIGVDGSMIAGRGILPGRPQIWVSGTLKIQVSADLPYTDSAGANVVWQSPYDSAGVDDGTCLDIASSVPAAVSGVPYYRWVWIVLDTTAGAAALVALNGTARNINMYQPNETRWTEIDTTGYLPLDAVRLITGDTDETTVIESRWKFARLLFGENTTAGSSAGAGSLMLDDDGNIMLDDDGNIMYTDA